MIPPRPNRRAMAAPASAPLPVGRLRSPPAFAVYAALVGGALAALAATRLAPFSPIGIPVGVLFVLLSLAFAPTFAWFAVRRGLGGSPFAKTVALGAGFGAALGAVALFVVFLWLVLFFTPSRFPRAFPLEWLILLTIGGVVCPAYSAWAGQGRALRAARAQARGAIVVPQPWLQAYLAAFHIAVAAVLLQTVSLVAMTGMTIFWFAAAQLTSVALAGDVFFLWALRLGAGPKSARDLVLGLALQAPMIAVMLIMAGFSLLELASGTLEWRSVGSPVHVDVLAPVTAVAVPATVGLLGIALAYRRTGRDVHERTTSV